MDAPLDAIHRVLLLHLHRVTQAERPEEQILMLLQTQSTCSFNQPIPEARYSAGDTTLHVQFVCFSHFAALADSTVLLLLDKKHY